VSPRRLIAVAVLAALSLALASLITSAGSLTSSAVAIGAAEGPLPAPAGVARSYVDGISDQSLPAWDGDFDDSYFAGLFDDAWAHGPGAHITFARYVVQWNVISGEYLRYLREFEAWLEDVASIGLKPEIALTSYDGVLPSSPSEYRDELVKVLARARALGHPIAWLEAWNEPNGQGDESAADAAALTNAASGVCRGEGDCTVIAGDFEDSPGVAAYEEEYVSDLHPVPANWGVHPYYSVQAESEAPFENVREHLPNGGGERRSGSRRSPPESARTSTDGWWRTAKPGRRPARAGW
jgi:hypothetical protein